jgi:hypothetical protein
MGLFIPIKTLKESPCPTLVHQLYSPQNIHSMEHYTARKKNKEGLYILM